MKSFIVENSDNSSYIDSLLFGLFYTISNIENLLHNDIDDPFKIYLQEYISTNFVNKIRSNKSVLVENIETIRQLCFYNGWMKGEVQNMTNYYSSFNIKYFFLFIMDTLDNVKIEIKEDYKKESFLSKKNTEETKSIDCIELIPRSNKSSIKELFSEWAQQVNEKGNENDLDHELETLNKSISNCPNIIPLYINRWDESGNKKNYEVDVFKKFKPYYHTIISNHEWIFHCMTCFEGDNIKNGHYYTVLLNIDKYYIFDNRKIPCIEELSSPTNQLVSKFKKDCVLVIYKLFY